MWILPKWSYQTKPLKVTVSLALTRKFLTSPTRGSGPSSSARTVTFLIQLLDLFLGVEKTALFVTDPLTGELVPVTAPTLRTSTIEGLLLEETSQGLSLPGEEHPSKAIERVQLLIDRVPEPLPAGHYLPVLLPPIHERFFPQGCWMIGPSRHEHP